MSDSLRIVGEADERTIQQMKNCLAVEEGSRGVLLPDNHLGYSQPIGGAVAYRDHISPSGVGYDIGCGNKAVRTNLLASDVRKDMPKIMDELIRRVSFGVGQSDSLVADHPVLDHIQRAEFRPQQKLFQKAKAQLGTVGAGNHYVDLFEEERTGALWIGVHFGSRGFGHKTASGFLALAQGKQFDEHAAEGEMMSPPVVFHQDSYLGYAYIDAMTLAGEYAYAGRDVVCDRVLDLLGAESVRSIHNHHNFAWREKHDGEDFWVVRKGCTPAFPGQEGFVGATMGETSVILEGTEGTRDALYSTVHGAGRAMSRSRAAGKVRKKWACLNRDCDWHQPPNTHKPEDGNCPKCGHNKLAKRLVQTARGEIDWVAELATVNLAGVELRGGAADEAPGAYKRLDEVLSSQPEVNIITRLRPIGVAMAPSGTVDPYKD